MKKSKKNVPLIEQLNNIAKPLFDQVDRFVSSVDTVATCGLIVPEPKSELGVELQRRHGTIHWNNLVKSIAKGEVRKMQHHAQKLKTQLRPVANDYPFAKGDKVYINRYEHGWNPGYIAVIEEVLSYNGTFAYEARVVEDDDGACGSFNIRINHTRDAFRCN
jgi:hypothetical protein